VRIIEKKKKKNAEKADARVATPQKKSPGRGTALEKEVKEGSGI